MTALAIVGSTVGGAIVGGVAGVLWGARDDDLYLNIAPLLDGLAGAAIGAIVGAVISAAVLA